MKCPVCLGDNTKIIDTRKSGDFRVTRKRECLSCGYKFVTDERVNYDEKFTKTLPSKRYRDIITESDLWNLQPAEDGEDTDSNRDVRVTAGV